MAGERNYLRVPPDSTGKRVRMVHGALVIYSSKTSGYAWKPGREDYVFSTASGDWIFHLHHVYESSLTSGTLDLSYEFNKMYDGSAPVAGDTIKDPDTGSVVATVVSVTDIYNNATNIVGYENPGHGLEIDNFGSANIRFSEGQPQLDAFGKLRVSGATLLGDYVFANSVLPIQFSTNMVKGGDVMWDSDRRAVVLSVPTTSGAIVAHTSNSYHHYTPGASHLFMATLALGDSGKTGLGRSWGMFDFQNGFHFVHREYPLSSGNFKLGVVLKSDVTGSVVDTYIWQDDWNRDRLDGTGPSGMIIDVTKDNLYWIDVQWLGAGRARFGVYYDGQRITCHEFYHGNNYAYPISGSGSLPVCFAQRTFAPTSGTSEMRVFCAAVWTETNIEIPIYGQPGQEIVTGSLTTNNQYVHLATISPDEFYPNGRNNRTLYFPTTIDVQAFDSVTGEDVRIELELKAESVMSDLDFQTQTLGSSMKVSTTGTYYGGGRAIYKSLIKGSAQLDMTTVYKNMTTGAIKNYAENGGHRHVDIASITNSSTAVLTVAYPQLTHRQGYAVNFTDLEGMTELNTTTNYYLKPISQTQAEIYTTSTYATPLDTTGFGVHTPNTGEAQGYYGTPYNVTILAKKYFGTNTATVYVKVGWKEVVQ
jgi:hypothetical protein